MNSRFAAWSLQLIFMPESQFTLQRRYLLQMTDDIREICLNKKQNKRHEHLAHASYSAS